MTQKPAGDHYTIYLRVRSNEYDFIEEMAHIHFWRRNVDAIRTMITFCQNNREAYEKYVDSLRML
jgi:hypothetical protein